MKFNEQKQLATIQIEMLPSCYVRINKTLLDGVNVATEDAKGKIKITWKGDQMWVPDFIAAQLTESDGVGQKPLVRIIKTRSETKAKQDIPIISEDDISDKSKKATV